MFEKVKRFAKKIATSKKTQMTCLMMVCGMTALMAQTTAGDYSAGTAALTQVSEEIAKYVPIVVKLCYAIAGGAAHRRASTSPRVLAADCKTASAMIYCCPAVSR